MDTYHISADCTSLSLCSYQYVSTRCLEVVSSGHVALHRPEVELEYLLSALAAASAPLQSLGVPYGTGLPLSRGILLLYGLSSLYRGLLMTQQLSPLRYPLCDSRVPNALEKSAQHSYATQKGLTRFPSHKHEGPQNLSKLQ